ncbi:DHS-like NAD/FAD-binding domain-containing protein [Pluteus cervinus]|uniref:DHS-like NAD/FAD-binding domain-containing protein n=1 Tax=Pluteus cervinus TaxID=181527 RepID=A0ACD3ABN8_9AGAR|nr:DHS-like NAD/FAD-binding domain-containing protein [Pluteus cervinus]
MPSDDIQVFREVLASSKNPIILSGAGLSARSGIATYRGVTASPLNQDGAIPYTTPEAFQKDPSSAWQHFHARRTMMLNAKPNDAHRALATLNLPDIQSRLAPNSASPPLHVTQNVDGLSFRVLDPLPEEVQSQAKERIIEMHGSEFITKCTSCRATRKTFEPILAASLADVGDDPSAPKKVIPVEKLPKCGGDHWNGSNRYGNCGGLLRPDVVWFGEVPPLMGEIQRKLTWCDLLIIVGSSFTVHPAAGFATQVKKSGGKIAVFNLERCSGDEDVDFLFQGDCSETLPRVFDVKEVLISFWGAP